MALVVQPSFLDRLSEAEGQLNELASFAGHLTNRLVGYADGAEDGYSESPPSNGILSEASDTALRMNRKARDIRAALQRIYDALPAEAVSTGTGVRSLNNPNR